MSHQYVPVQWNRKIVFYDLTLWLGIVVYIVLFVATTRMMYQGNDALSPIITMIRALSTCAFTMLTIILCMGPLARLDKRFLPLLYNRRHFGVSMFIVALLHGILATIFNHGFGVLFPLVSIFSSPGSYTSINDVPFQPFGVVALFLLLLLASTSHDFWNTNLGPILWKSLHMSVYLVYVLLVIHVATGAMQQEVTGMLPALLIGSVGLVSSLHLAAALKVSSGDKGLRLEEWVDVGDYHDIENNHAMTVTIGQNERVAIFRYDNDHIAAVGNACKHQSGPLGEGKIIDGCITCPWHGFQYSPLDGRAPPPFNEKIPTYRIKLEGDRIMLNPTALPDGTAREVAIIGGSQ